MLIAAVLACGHGSSASLYDFIEAHQQEVCSKINFLLAGHRVWSIKAASIMAGRTTSRPQDRKWVDFNRNTISFTLPTCPEVRGCPAMSCIAYNLVGRPSACRM